MAHERATELLHQTRSYQHHIKAAAPSLSLSSTSGSNGIVGDTVAQLFQQLTTRA